MTDSRKHVSSMPARVRVRDDGKIEVSAPAVGLWREGPAPGQLVVPGQSIGALEVLGRRVRLVAPPGAAGVIVSNAIDRARAPVDFGHVLLTLDPEVQGAGIDAQVGTATSGSDADMVFKSPTSGRFYARPSPDKPAFVSPGDIIETGHTVALLEVMKTFNRVQYGGPGLPTRAKVVRVVPDNESDVDAGDALIELEPA